MALPYRPALERKPQAIVLLEVLVKGKNVNPNVVDFQDFDWFESDAARTEAWESLTKWADEMIATHLDVNYVLVEIPDTTTMTVGRVSAHGKKVQWLVDAVAADFVGLLPQAKIVGVKAPAKAEKKVAVVKARKQSPAALAAKKAAEEAAAVVPVPKAAKARAAAKAAARPGGADAAAALKARIEAKQAEASTDEKAPLGWVIPLARRGNGRFTKV